MQVVADSELKVTSGQSSQSSAKPKLGELNLTGKKVLETVPWTSWEDWTTGVTDFRVTSESVNHLISSSRALAARFPLQISLRSQGAKLLHLGNWRNWLRSWASRQETQLRVELPGCFQ